MNVTNAVVSTGLDLLSFGMIPWFVKKKVINLVKNGIATTTENVFNTKGVAKSLLLDSGLTTLQNEVADKIREDKDSWYNQAIEY